MLYRRRGGIYTYGFSNLGLISYAGRQAGKKKKKSQNPKIQKLHTCVYIQKTKRTP